MSALALGPSISRALGPGSHGATHGHEHHAASGREWTAMAPVSRRRRSVRRSGRPVLRAGLLRLVHRGGVGIHERRRIRDAALADGGRFRARRRPVACARRRARDLVERCAARAAVAGLSLSVCGLVDALRVAAAPICANDIARRAPWRAWPFILSGDHHVHHDLSRRVRRAAARRRRAADGSFACATCGCSLSTDAAMGYSADTGWHLSLQYDFINQNQLRIGTRAVSAAQVAAINDAGGEQEVEQRDHQPLHDPRPRLLAERRLEPAPARALHRPRPLDLWRRRPTRSTSDQLSGSTHQGPGRRPLHRHRTRAFSRTRASACSSASRRRPVATAARAPTAPAIVGRSPTAFSSGPISQNPSPANLVDTSLQPGNGSTDVIVGAYYHRSVSRQHQRLRQRPVPVGGRRTGSNQPGQDFRPGNTTTVSFGGAIRGQPGHRAAAAGERLSQGPRPGRARRQPRQRRHRRLPGARRDRRRSRRTCKPSASCSCRSTGT